MIEDDFILLWVPTTKQTFLSSALRIARLNWASEWSQVSYVPSSAGSTWLTPPISAVSLSTSHDCSPSRQHGTFIRAYWLWGSASDRESYYASCWYSMEPSAYWSIARTWGYRESKVDRQTNRKIKWKWSGLNILGMPLVVRYWIPSRDSPGGGMLPDLCVPLHDRREYFRHDQGLWATSVFHTPF